jgi:hypothetical protein
MGVVDQVRETSVEGTAPLLHYPITLRVITGCVGPLDPHQLTGLVKKEDIKALHWSVTKTEPVPWRATISRV